MKIWKGYKLIKYVSQLALKNMFVSLGFITLIPDLQKLKVFNQQQANNFITYILQNDILEVFVFNCPVLSFISLEEFCMVPSQFA